MTFDHEHFKAAVALYKEGNFAECRQLVEEVLNSGKLESNELRRKLLHLSADCLLDEGNFIQAAEVYSGIIRNHPEDPVAHANRGFAHFELENWNKAVEDYQKSISLLPEASAYRMLGQALVKLDRLTEAVVALRKSIMLKPNNSFAVYKLGQTYYNLGRPLNAYRLLQQAVSLNPQNNWALKGIRIIEEDHGI